MRRTSLDPKLIGERTLPFIPAENYWFRRHVAAYRLAASRVEGMVVDAGCGEGYGAAILARRARRVIGLDIDEPTLTHALARYPAVGFVRADLTRLPLGAVAGVVCLQVLEHLEDPDGFLGECRRVLRPGGAFVLSTPNRLTFPAGINPFHIREYDPRELGTLLGHHFPEVRVGGVTHGRRLRWLDRALGEPIQHRLVRTPYPKLPLPVRAALRTVTAGSFVATRDAERALDLLAVCRVSRSR